jgi:hypothetical protein
MCLGELSARQRITVAAAAEPCQDPARCGQRAAACRAEARENWRRGAKAGQVENGPEAIPRAEAYEIG